MVLATESAMALLVLALMVNALLPSPQLWLGLSRTAEVWLVVVGRVERFVRGMVKV